MKYLHPVAAIPNELINDTAVHYTTKAVALALLFLAGRKNRSVTVAFGELAKLSHCSVATAQQAIKELIRGGYIIKERSYRYSDEKKRLIYAANRYAWIKRTGGYTLLRREIMDYAISPATLANLLYLYRCGGRKGRAFPSLRRIAGKLKAAGKAGLDMAKSTVCRALKALRLAQAVVRHHCSTRQGCYASNSYYLTDMVITGSTGSRFAGEGSPKFSKHKTINQITEAYTEEERKNGVGEFGRLYNFERDIFLTQSLYFDGVGVRVSAGDEPDLTA